MSIVPAPFFSLLPELQRLFGVLATGGRLGRSRRHVKWQIEPRQARTRRRWSATRKAVILAEPHEPGETLSAVARRHALSSGAIHRWRGTLPGAKIPIYENSDPD